MKQSELPLGFTMALAQHPHAMEKLAAMPPSEKAELLRRAHAVSSKSEMQALVASLDTPD